ncbi:MAG: hypothetical protein WC236_01430 [Gallionellaceae bacterium]
MSLRAKYRYIKYDPQEDEYFGCRDVVHAEWNYVYKRRASREGEFADTSGIVSTIVTESDGYGGFIIKFARIVARVKRKIPEKNESREKNEARPAPARPPDLSGIALSGGGIRSASFCLGILQAFAYAGWLKKIDYMSTVSGGGYIGGSLSWLLHKKWKGEQGEEIPYGLERKNFPYGTYPMVGMEDKSEEGGTRNWNVYKGRMLRHLRQHASYLMPGNGINLMSLAAVVLRNVLFSVFVYGSLLVVLYLIAWPIMFEPIRSMPLLDWMAVGHDWLPEDANRAQASAILLAAGFVFASIAYVLMNLLLPKVMSSGYRLRFFYERLMGRLLFFMLVLTVISFVPLAYCWINEAGRGESANVAVQASGTTDELELVSFTGSFKNSAESRLAQGEFKLVAQTGRSVANASAENDTSAPRESVWRLSVFQNNLAALVGGLSTLAGAIMSIMAFAQERRRKKKIPTAVFVAVASFALIFGLLLVSFHVAVLLREEAASSGVWKPGEYFSVSELVQNYWLVTPAVLLLLLLRFPNLNYLSLHRYYRDRLMETFTPELPDAINVNGPVPGANKSADYTHLYELLNEKGGAGELGPYHIINTNIVLVSSAIPKFRGRGGDNFILTPKYCGSNATGWCETRGSPYNDMTPATALAISGAAVNSNAGSAGDGVTRTPFLSFLMGFFNIRLGYWVENPAPRAERLRRIAEEKSRPLQMLPEWNGEAALAYILRIVWHGLFVILRWPVSQLEMLFHRVLSWPLCASASNPNAFYPGIFEIYLRKNLDENSRMIQLSDGGHFENLGLYELVRRQLKLIIVCDGTADPNFGFEDLANAIEKVRADFGALILLDCANMEALTPSSVIETGDAADKKVTYATRGYLVGRIIYKDRSEGTLLYMTTTFFRGLSADLYAYRKRHSEFPDQATSDQFFDEKQFEAYRELGYQTAYEMMRDDKATGNEDVQRILGEPQIGRASAE